MFEFFQVRRMIDLENDYKSLAVLLSLFREIAHVFYNAVSD